jgi:Ran-binding protein 9/10
LSETELIQSLVLQFLTHNGHTETAKAFADEVYTEKTALTIDPNAEVQGFDVKEDEDAGHQQRTQISQSKL